MWDALERVRSDWNRYAEADPLWAILTDPRRKGRGWDPAEFFETGRWEIEELLRYAAGLGIEIGRGRALDFGCGVGRLTRALAAHFTEVWGVDISPVMIERARNYNAHLANCRFVQNADTSFAALPAAGFDLIYSNITLQHIPPRHTRRYLEALMRRLEPGGLLVFQLPGESRTGPLHRALRTLYKIGRRLLAKPVMEMYGVPKERVIALVGRSGCRIVDVATNDAAGPEWASYRYAVTRPARG